MHDHREYPMPDPKMTPWLETALRILAIGVTTDISSAGENEDTKEDSIKQDEDQ